MKKVLLVLVASLCVFSASFVFASGGDWINGSNVWIGWYPLEECQIDGEQQICASKVQISFQGYEEYPVYYVQVYLNNKNMGSVMPMRTVAGKNPLAGAAELLYSNRSEYFGSLGIYKKGIYDLRLSIFGSRGFQKISKRIEIGDLDFTTANVETAGNGDKAVATIMVTPMFGYDISAAKEIKVTISGLPARTSTLQKHEYDSWYILPVELTREEIKKFVNNPAVKVLFEFNGNSVNTEIWLWSPYNEDYDQ